MSEVCVKYQSAVYLNIKACQEVALCLPINPWAGRTQTGTAFIKATVQNSGRYLGSNGFAFVSPWENPRCEEHYQYEFCYDDSQLLIDGGTGQPYVFECSDIIDVVSACIADAIAELVP